MGEKHSSQTNCNLFSGKFQEKVLFRNKASFPCLNLMLLIVKEIARLKRLSGDAKSKARLISLKRGYLPNVGKETPMYVCLYAVKLSLSGVPR